MKQGLAEGVFPGAVLLVSRSERRVFFEAYGKANIFTERPITVDTVFDLASLTKPLATTLAVMALIESKQLSLDRPLSDIWSSFKHSEKSGVCIDQLLTHVSGLPAYRPYYKEINCLPETERHKALLDRLLHEPLLNPPGKHTVYSDLGFMLLGLVIEKITGSRLDQFVSRKLFHPLGIKNLFFIDIHENNAHREFAATAYCPWRGQLVQGGVHDENAFALGGVAGHAGLFGTAGAVEKLLSALLRAFATTDGIFSRALVRQFLSRYHGADRALGFDMPSAEGSSAGKHLNREATVGHLGFTGTSFWMAMDRSTIIILLTNRIHPSPANEGIKAFRPRLHDSVMACF